LSIFKYLHAAFLWFDSTVNIAVSFAETIIYMYLPADSLWSWNSYVCV